MARPTKYATLICIVCTLLAALGILIGLWQKNAVYTIFALLPAVGYEAYRTEGASTRFASWAILVVFIAELVLFLFKIDIDLVKFLGTDRNIRGYNVPIGDIKVVGSALMAVLSIILFTRTRGIYTRWLAVIIILTSLAIIYILSPTFFTDLLRRGADQV
jgi:hypothetical protein